MPSSTISDDLATLRRRITNYASVSQDHEGFAALARVEAEMARLRNGRDMWKHEAGARLEQAKAAEAEVARLQDGLRYYAERRNYRPAAGGHHDVPIGGWMEVADSYDGRGAGARARALLAEDGAA